MPLVYIPSLIYPEMLVLKKIFHPFIVPDLHDGSGEAQDGTSGGAAQLAEAKVGQDWAGAAVSDSGGEEKAKEKEKGAY